MHLTIPQLERALAVQDPALPELIVTLSYQSDVLNKEPTREGALTFAVFLQEINSYSFRKKTRIQQYERRCELLTALEAEDAEVPLTDRLRLHEVLIALWQDKSLYSRRCLLSVIPKINLTYGPWRALKSIFKDAERTNDTQIYGCLAARFDTALSTHTHSVSQATLAYLTRRAWRYLRRLGQTLPSLYADAASDVLACYDNSVHWPKTWVANHIFHHESGQYNRRRFTLHPHQDSLLKNRAFPDAWQRTPKPLLALLEYAKADHVQQFAIDSLKADFRDSLREIEPRWVQSLVGRSALIDEFVVWIFDNVSRFEKAAFVQLGLHQAVLFLLNSDSEKACKYGADYARTYARNLPLEQLLSLVDSRTPVVRKLALDLLQARDARKEVGLEAWGQLLDTRYGANLATEMLRKYFGKKELTPEWFEQRFLAPENAGLKFAMDYLLQLYPGKSLGAEYFCGLLQKLDYETSESYTIVNFACEKLLAYDLNSLSIEFLKTALINPHMAYQLFGWVDEGRLNPAAFSIDFLKTIAYHPSWENDNWISQLKETYQWAKNLTFSETTSKNVLTWLADVRIFSPGQLGFDWLMSLVQRGEKRYHEFALQVLSKSFSPADFAPEAEIPSQETSPAPSDEVIVDFDGQSFLFTGKLATMTRAEANKKVIAAGGSKSSGVTKNLHYLVIGDEGSALYGEGRKGSKQVKAEKLVANGAEIKIISETAFLQMLTGKKQELSEDAIEKGCQRLWEMLTKTDRDDAPLATFAESYFKLHHPNICLAQTDRPVDPGMEIPSSFLTFERIEPLLNENHKQLRDFALEIAAWEFSRWQPSASAIVRLIESPFEEVRQFITQALTADDQPEHKHYRINPNTLTTNMVYSFCESQDEHARAVGMLLIERHPRLKQPEQLFRLTESPDRKVRAFVIKTFWSWYRNRGITMHWQPPADEKNTHDHNITMLSHPDQKPNDLDDIQLFLRRILFEIPPARYSKKALGEDQIKERLPALPARKAKIQLIETLRDVALQDSHFAKTITPLLKEFIQSRGKSEQAACLVAHTQIEHRYTNQSVIGSA
jgi:hypothetical protein